MANGLGCNIDQLSYTPPCLYVDDEIDWRDIS